jgi:hypothetical protein
MQLHRADGATLGQLSKALSGKLAPTDAPQDLVAAVWGFAQLNHKPDAGLLSKAAAGIKGAAGQLTAEQQVCRVAVCVGMCGERGGRLNHKPDARLLCEASAGRMTAGQWMSVC